MYSDAHKAGRYRGAACRIATPCVHRGPGLLRCRRRPTPRRTAVTRAMPVMPSRGRRGLRGMRRVCSRAAAQLQPSHFRKYSLHLVLAGHRHAPLPHARSATPLYLGHSLALVTALALALDGHRATECSSVRTVSVGGWGCVCVKHNEAPVQRYRAVSYIACCMLHAVCCLLHAACQCSARSCFALGTTRPGSGTTRCGAMRRR